MRSQESTVWRSRCRWRVWWRRSSSARAVFDRMTPEILLIGIGLAILLPVVPFALEMLALRRLTTAAFGTLMALEPAFAMLVGLADPASGAGAGRRGRHLPRSGGGHRRCAHRRPILTRARRGRLLMHGATRCYPARHGIRNVGITVRPRSQRVGRRADPCARAGADRGPRPGCDPLRRQALGQGVRDPGRLSTLR